LQPALSLLAASLPDEAIPAASKDKLPEVAISEAAVESVAQNKKEDEMSEGMDVAMDSLNSIIDHIGSLDLRTIRQQPGESWSSKTGVKDEAWKSKWETMQDDLACCS